MTNVAGGSHQEGGSLRNTYGSLQGLPQEIEPSSEATKPDETMSSIGTSLTSKMEELDSIGYS